MTPTAEINGFTIHNSFPLTLSVWICACQKPRNLIAIRNRSYIFRVRNTLQVIHPTWSLSKREKASESIFCLIFRRLITSNIGTYRWFFSSHGGQPKPPNAVPKRGRSTNILCKSSTRQAYHSKHWLVCTTEKEKLTEISAQHNAVLRRKAQISKIGSQINYCRARRL